MTDQAAADDGVVVSDVPGGPSDTTVTGREVATVAAAPVERSARAQGYNDLFNLAKSVSSTSMVPKALRGHPDECFAVMAYGVELGLEPFAAMRSVHIIEGTPTCSAQLMRGLIQAHGHRIDWLKVTDTEVVVRGRRRGGSTATVRWTIDDARRAKLMGKGNWSTYPRAMLAARATSELARLLFADLLHGLAYTPEEVGAVGEWADVDVEHAPAIIDVGDYGDGYGDGPSDDSEEPEPDDDPADIEDAEWVEQAKGTT